MMLLGSLGLLGIVYIIARSGGLIGGSRLGALFGHVSKNVRNYVGLGILSQAGVAIGLALSIQNHAGLEAIAPVILNIVIATTFIHELLGPFMTKYAIEMSGESNKKGVQDV